MHFLPFWIFRKYKSTNANFILFPHCFYVSNDNKNFLKNKVDQDDTFMTRNDH